MKSIHIIFAISVLFVFSCNKNQAVYQPAGGLTKEDLEKSHLRAKKLNSQERAQIQGWIANQEQKFYPMGLNYWINIENAALRSKKEFGAAVSYQYELYDFDQAKLYEEKVKKENVNLGKFKELGAVMDALHYLEKGEKATLLVPSVLAYGTYGDGKKIGSDIPLMVKLEVL